MSEKKCANTDDLLLEALLVSPTIKSAAEYAQVDRRTIYNYLADESFSQKHRELRSPRLDSIVSSLDRLSQLAIMELERVLLDPETKPRDRISAAKAVLSARGYKVDQR